MALTMRPMLLALLAAYPLYLLSAALVLGVLNALMFPPFRANPGAAILEVYNAATQSPMQETRKPLLSLISWESSVPFQALSATIALLFRRLVWAATAAPAKQFAVTITNSMVSLLLAALPSTSTLRLRVARHS